IETALEDTNAVNLTVGLFAFCLFPVSFTKPGECPPQSSGRLCTRSCRSDSNCPNNKKCCSNGCGRYCNAPYPGICVILFWSVDGFTK
uniref:WAP domain-containing protein n=1 Tax=Sinocyclocheilus anshuiensis TaxID=1608454 RepID=A0A671MLW8_9TELE